VREMTAIGKELTQLEQQLHSKVQFIEQFLIQTKYLPTRVEPGIAFELESERNWSKYTRQTLFINQKLLQEKGYRELIFWREAFLLFAPKSMRDAWWLKILANIFPLTHKCKSSQNEKWERLIRASNPEFKYLIDKCMLICATAGPDGIIKALKQSLYQVMSKEMENEKNGRTGVTILHPQEFEIILTNVYFDFVKITENALSVMELVLLKNSIKANEIAQFVSKHPSSIAKVINKLLNMNVLRHQYSVNYFSLGLTQFIVLFNCTKEQSGFFKSIPENPYLFSHKFNCLNTCVITQYYVAPRSKQFYKKLVDQCQNLKNQNKIVDFYAFEITTSFRNFHFKYFNTKTQEQNINFNDLTIESNIFDADSPIPNIDRLNIGNIVVPTGIVDSKPIEFDLLDLQILNQFIIGNTTRRTIQKRIRKDMNEIIRRINRLFDEKVLYEHIWAVLPDSNAEVTLYIEEPQRKSSKSSSSSITERLTHFSKYLPNVYVAQIKGSYNGLLMRSYLPHSITLAMADFLIWFLPENVNNQIILGNSNFKKYRGELSLDRWNNGNWLFFDEDFVI
jgi:hypothetical protein